MVNDDDGEMNCRFEIDNRNPPQVTIVTEVLGDDSGSIAYDYSVDYAVWGANNITFYVARNATTRTISAFPGSSIDVTATAATGGSGRRDDDE